MIPLCHGMLFQKAPWYQRPSGSFCFTCRKPRILCFYVVSWCIQSARVVCQLYIPTKNKPNTESIFTEGHRAVNRESSPIPPTIPKQLTSDACKQFAYAASKALKWANECTSFIFTKFYSRGPYWQYVIINLGNGWVTNKRQAITWNNDDPVHWRTHITVT